MVLGDKGVYCIAGKCHSAGKQLEAGQILTYSGVKYFRIKDLLDAYPTLRDAQTNSAEVRQEKLIAKFLKKVSHG